MRLNLSHAKETESRLQVQFYSKFWLLEVSQNAEMAFFGVVGIMWLSVAGIKYWDEAM